MPSSSLGAFAARHCSDTAAEQRNNLKRDTLCMLQLRKITKGQSNRFGPNPPASEAT